MVMDLQCNWGQKFDNNSEISDAEPSSNFWHKFCHSLSNFAFTHENKTPQNLFGRSPSVKHPWDALATCQMKLLTITIITYK